jgi:hypothetical protein
VSTAEGVAVGVPAFDVGSEVLEASLAEEGDAVALVVVNG